MCSTYNVTFKRRNSGSSVKMEMKREMKDEGVFKHLTDSLQCYFFIFEIDGAGINYHTKSQNLPEAFESTMVQSGSSQINPGIFEMIQFDLFNLLQRFILRFFFCRSDSIFN